MKTVEVGKKVIYCGKVYTLVGIANNYVVYANLAPVTLEDTICLEFTDEEIEEFYKEGKMKDYE